MNKISLVIIIASVLTMLGASIWHKPLQKREIKQNAFCDQTNTSNVSQVKKEDKYVVIFAYQNARTPRPFYSHVFASWFAEVDNKVKNGFTVSWYGEKNVPGTQKGVNLDLQSTYDRAARQGLTVFRFGPYFCTDDFYDRAKKLHQDLGNMDYNVLDKLTKGDGAFNCIHAVGFASGQDVDTKLSFGKEAAEKLIAAFKKRNLMAAKAEEKLWPEAKAYFLPGQN